LPPAARAELIHVLRLPDFDRVDALLALFGAEDIQTIAGAT